MDRSSVSSYYGPEDLERGTVSAEITEPRSSSCNSARPDSYARPESLVRSSSDRNPHPSQAMASNNSFADWPRVNNPPWTKDEPAPRVEDRSELPDTPIVKNPTPPIKEHYPLPKSRHRRLATPLRAIDTTIKAEPAGTTGPISPYRTPPSVHFDTPMSTAQKSIRSIDIMQAAGQLPWQLRAEPEPSAKSLLSGLRDKGAPSAFAQQVFAAGREELVYEVAGWSHGGKKRCVSHNVLDLTTLQRMSQYALQQKLVAQVQAMSERGAWTEVGVRKTLHQYCETIRDLELMETRAVRKGCDDPFIISTQNALQAQLLEDADLVLETRDFRPVGAASFHFASARRAKSGGFMAWVRRLLMAFVGGVALIAPFVIMILLSGTLARIVTTCGFMVIFAVALATGSEMSADRVGLITAAYAAVLVVFVGTNPPSYFPS